MFCQVDGSNPQEPDTLGGFRPDMRLWHRAFYTWPFPRGSELEVERLSIEVRVSDAGRPC